MLSAGVGHARTAGDPLLRNYDPPLMNTQYWAVAQGPNGMMYFGSNEGVLRYDGASWTISPTTNRTPVRSLAIDASGRVFVGGVGDFGYLKSDRLGVPRFFSLSAGLKDSERRFGTVWKTYLDGDGVLFQSNELLLRWSEQGIKSWRPDTSFQFSFMVNGTLWILERGVGLQLLADDGLRLVPGGAAFKADSVYMAVPYAADQVLVATRDRGLFLIGDGGVAPFLTEVDEQLRTDPVYHGLWLDSQRLALATTAGVFIVNRSGQHELTLNADSGLQTDTARFLFLDREDGLWIALNRGLARVELLSPFTTLGERHGVAGVTVDIARWRGRLYVGTSQGLFVADANSSGPAEGFQQVPGIRWPVFSLAEVNGALLAATNQGLFEVTGEDVALIAPGIYTVLRASRRHQGTVYAGRMDGLSVWRAEGTTWVPLGDYAPGDWVHTIVESANSELWLGTRATGFVCLSLGALGIPAEPPRRYSVAAGLPEGGSEVYWIDNDVVFSTDAGLFSYDAQGDRFLPDERFGQAFADGSRWVGNLIEDPAGRAWLTWGTVGELQGPDAGYDMHLSVAGEDPARAERWNGALERIRNQRIFSVIPDLQDAVIRRLGPDPISVPARRAQ